MLTELLTKILKEAFQKAGYDSIYGDVVKSARPDLCQFQCNGAMSASKMYKKAPFIISDEVVGALKATDVAMDVIEVVETVKPGFINITIKDSYLAHYCSRLIQDDRGGCVPVEKPTKIILDYGGPNVAKPLHIGHLRTAIIGESLKRLFQFLGHQTIADVHLGDWGLQMGMIIYECSRRYSDLPYFDESFQGEYPEQPPFTLAELEDIYPYISKLSKENEEVLLAAKDATFKLQNGHPGYLALWKKFVEVSLVDVKKIYDRLDVSFDLWYGESDANPYVADVVKALRDKGVVKESEGALIVEISEQGDVNPIPPLLLYKSDGSILYSTTDLATIYQRIKDYHPDSILYVVDNRQSTHFTQVFRCAHQNGFVPDDVSLEHIGFGTMNGKDGKPFKTRDGGIAKLWDIIEMVENSAKEKIRDQDGLLVDEIAKIIGLATLKFADLSNFRTKDYIFDLEKFSSFEGKTGPYLLYSYVRVNNIVNKLSELGLQITGELLTPVSDIERSLLLKLDDLPAALHMAARDRAPSTLCEYVYDLATLMNSFYHTHHIINEQNLNQQRAWAVLCTLALKNMHICLDILGMKVPEKM